MVSTWVGTNDTPASGSWSPTNNTSPSNMVETESYVYDGGGVGDGNLTEDIRVPRAAVPRSRRRSTWYDWRDRLVAEKDGVQTSETSRGEPTADRLHLRQPERGDGDAGVRGRRGGADDLGRGAEPFGASRRRTCGRRAPTSYDEQGQVYRTDTYDVNPTTGSVGTNTLYTLTWHDARGNVIETQAPGGLVTKDTFDGAGRLTMEYQTDGGGGTGYAAASSVSSDTVLTQTAYTYDSDGNLTETVTRDRFDTATGTGALGTPTTGVNARVSYMAYYYDLANREIASVDVGTNGGTAWTRARQCAEPVEYGAGDEHRLQHRRGAGHGPDREPDGGHVHPHVRRLHDRRHRVQRLGRHGAERAWQRWRRSGAGT